MNEFLGLFIPKFWKNLIIGLVLGIFLMFEAPALAGYVFLNKGNLSVKHAALLAVQQPEDFAVFHEKIAQAEFWLTRALLSRAIPNANIYKAQGELARLEKDPEKSISAFQQATESDPYNILAWYRLAQLYDDSNQMELAISAWKQAGLAIPISNRYYFTGAKYEQQGDLPSAEKYFNYALEADPTFIDAYYALIGIYWATGRTEDFVRVAKSTLVLDQSNSSRRVFEQGRLFLLDGQTEMAIDAFQKSLSIDPGFCLAHRFLIVALQQAGRSSEADEAIRNTIAGCEE